VTGCPVPSKSGGACTSKLGPRGLCHLHDPDAPFALQHPAYRGRLLRRPEVVALLQAAAAEPVSAQASLSITVPPVRRTSPTGSYTAELEHLLDAAAKLLDRSGPGPGEDAAQWRIRVRRWREDVAASRELGTVRR